MSHLSKNNPELSSEIDRCRLGNPSLKFRQKLILFSICFTYITIVPLRQFLSSINPSLKNDIDLNFTNSLAGVIYVIAGLGYSIGKLLDGIFIDKFGCIKCFIIFQIITILCVILFSFFNNIYYFSVILCINAFVQAGTWPSLSKLIYKYYSPAQFVCCFACLGISSRLGSAYSKAFIGYLLYLDYTWRETVRIIAILGIAGLIWFVLWCLCFLQKSDQISFIYRYPHVLKSNINILEKERIKKQLTLNNNDNNNTSLSSLRHQVEYNDRVIFNNETLYNKLIRFFTNRRFLLICLSNMFITMVVGLDGFSELLLNDVLSSSASSQSVDSGIYVMVASSFPLGLTIALLISYVFLRDYPRSWLASYVNISLFLAILFCLSILGWTTIMEIFGCFDIFTCLSSISLLLFSYGYLLAYPYYIQTGIFALRFGGNDAALVACLIDFCGYLPSSILLICGAWLSIYGWRYVFILTFINITGAAISFMYFNYYDVKHEKQQQIILLNMIQSSTINNANNNNNDINNYIIPQDIINGSNINLINNQHNNNISISDSSDTDTYIND